ncbi:MAG: MBL fold metallo-hydrolase [Candidatus Berkelbacteria bacterium]|nr:MBL fold metallo-hydrolase [Candidatus Berkelbacteria bacterium]
MQIKYRGGQTFEVKSKDLEINFSGNLSINGFVFPGPGEYEKGGVIINGIADGDNTIYIIHLEDMTVCHLGKINHGLSEEEAKQAGDIDILFLPLGQDGSADLKTSLKSLSKIDPRIVVPMLFDESILNEFKKSEGYTDGELDILKIKKIDLPEEERKIVILAAL